MNRLRSESFWIWTPPTPPYTAYGNREGRFYHGHYHDYCYLPLYVFCGEHLLCSRLRMSNIDASADSVEELEPGPEGAPARIRQRWPAVKIWLRGDGGFCREKLMAWCESQGTALAGTELEKAQCGTIRLKLLKIGAQIRVTVHKVWISLSGNYPYAALFTSVLTHFETGCVSS